MNFNNETLPADAAGAVEEEDERSSLATAAVGARVVVLALDFEREVGAWLDAVGLTPGEELVILRRAIFRGPIHVRTSSGGEFAVAPELAEKIRVRVA